MIGRAVAQLLPPGFAVSRGALRFDGQDLVRMALGGGAACSGATSRSFRKSR